MSMLKQSFHVLAVASVLSCMTLGSVAWASGSWSGSSRAKGKNEARFLRAGQVDARATDHLVKKTDQKGWIHGRLEIGWRLAMPNLDDDYCWDESQETGFLGTMSWFEEKDDVELTNFILAYHFTDWFGVSASWDQIAATAYTHTIDHHIDGDWKEHGPTLTAVLATPKLFGFLVPYGEFGVHFPTAKYEARPWWNLGYASQEIYDEFDHPKKARHGYRRIINATETDSTTFVWGVGLKCYLTDNLVIDVTYRHVDVDETAHFYLMSGSHLLTDNGYYDIPLSYSELCAGLRWAF